MIQIELVINSHDESVGKYIMMNRVNSNFSGGVHLDLRKMNRIGLASSNLAILGPGGTWADVLRELPPSEYTMIHGQCTSVGVAGYILGK